MMPRSLLRGQLGRAWERTISGTYDSRLINSERGLQLHFCVSLSEEFEASGVERVRRLFVEPTAAFGGIWRSPDLMICNTRSVIGVVEFKYLPRTLPRYKKDLNTLRRLRKTAGNVTISNERYKGSAKPRSYKVVGDAVFCWAAVYSSPEPSKLPSRLTNSIGPGFFRLDALTRDDGPARVFVDGSAKAGKSGA